MTAPSGFKVAHLADSMEETRKWGCSKPPFFAVTIAWSKPEPWSMKDRLALEGRVKAGLLYVIVRDHHRSGTRENVEYVGLTTNAKTRFGNHPAATALRGQRGSTTISFGKPSFGRRRDYKGDAKPALEELEHLVIWALSTQHELKNEKKIWTLPGMGTNPGRAWHITNTGHRFAGRMPLEIVYPWMLLKTGRDRSVK